MGKQKGNNSKPVKNVFKVAGARSLRIKNKAKTRTGQLKKLNELTRKMTEEADKNFRQLDSQDFRDCTAPVSGKQPIVIEKEPVPENLEPKSAETLNKLDELKM